MYVLCGLVETQLAVFATSKAEFPITKQNPARSVSGASKPWRRGLKKKPCPRIGLVSMCQTNLPPPRIMMPISNPQSPYHCRGRQASSEYEIHQEIIGSPYRSRFYWSKIAVRTSGAEKGGLKYGAAVSKMTPRMDCSSLRKASCKGSTPRKQRNNKV